MEPAVLAKTCQLHGSPAADTPRCGLQLPPLQDRHHSLLRKSCSPWGPYPHQQLTDLRFGEGHGAVQDLGDAQVTEHEAPVAQQEDVLRLDIPVQHVILVHVVDGERDLQAAAATAAAADSPWLRCCVDVQYGAPKYKE